MERKNYSQLELFSENASQDLPQERVSGSFRDYIRAYEKVVFFFIGLVIVGIVSFCLGVERGKTIAMTKLSARFDVARTSTAPAKNTGRSVQMSTFVLPAAAQPQAARPRPAVSPAPKPQTPVSAPAAPQQGANGQAGYTIQVASFKNAVFATQETSALKKKGFPAAAVSQGEYTVVYVGKFTNKEMAQPLLSQLRQKYRNCYVRRL
jgi:cell division septation protein DedD